MGEQGVLFIAGFGFSATLFILLVFGINAVLSPRRPTPDKIAPYECGMPQAGTAWSKMDLRFSSIAVLFVLFDAIAILLFATSVKLRGSLDNAYPIAIFFLIFCLGLLYAWRKGALQWR